MFHQCLHLTVVCKITHNAYFLLIIQELMMAKVYRPHVTPEACCCCCCLLRADAGTDDGQGVQAGCEGEHTGVLCLRSCAVCIVLPGTVQSLRQWQRRQLNADNLQHVEWLTMCCCLVFGVLQVIVTVNNRLQLVEQVRTD